MQLLHLAVISFFALYVSAKMQNITVKGVVVCQKKRIPSVTVKLFERDRYSPNDLLAEQLSYSEGEFELFGEQDEYGMIEPFLTFEHKCRAKPGCRRISEYVIPQAKINGEYDMNYVILDIQSQVEKEVC